MPAKRINVAVAGLGFMGLTHLRAYQRLRGARIVAVCDIAPPSANGPLRGVAGNIQSARPVRLDSNVKIHRQFDELLANGDVDLIDICTPTALHPNQVIAALRAGKHVLCEKPLAQTAADARHALKVAGFAKGFLMPAMCMRFWPGWSWLKQVADEETYGRILAARFRRVSERPRWGKTGVHAGGALLDLHIHDTDFVNYLFGPPEKVFSTGVRGAGGAVDHVATQYFYRRGPSVHAEGSWLLPKGFNMSYTLHCERATIDFDLNRGPAALQIAEKNRSFRVIKPRGTDGYDEEIRYFVDCIARGAAPKIVTARDAVTALEICEAEEKSVGAGAVASV